MSSPLGTQPLGLEPLGVEPVGTGTTSSLGLNDDLLKLISRAAEAREKRRFEQRVSTIAQQESARLESEDRAREQEALANLAQTPEQFETFRQPTTEEAPTGWLSRLFTPFQILQERVIEPGAGVTAEAVQRMIPGEQEIERKTREFQAQGIGPIESRRRAWVESDLPSTNIPVLPFSIPLPAGRSFQRVDVGVKGGVELLTDPLNLLLGTGVFVKGTGAAGRLLQKGAIPQAVSAGLRSRRAAAAIPERAREAIPELSRSRRLAAMAADEPAATRAPDAPFGAPPTTAAAALARFEGDFSEGLFRAESISDDAAMLLRVQGQVARRFKDRLEYVTPTELRQIDDELERLQFKADEIAERAKLREEFQPEFDRLARAAAAAEALTPQVSVPTPELLTKTQGTKVVDATGSPLTVYHGSQNIFEQFDPGRANPDALYGPGVYFTDNPDVASGYARTASRSLKIEDILRYNIRPLLREKFGDDPVMDIRQNSYTKEITLDVAEGGWDDRLESLGFKPSLDPAGNVRRGKYTIPPYLLEQAEQAPNITPAFLRITNPLDIDAPLAPALREYIQQLATDDDFLDFITENLLTPDKKYLSADDILAGNYTNDTGYRILEFDYIRSYGTRSGARAEVNDILADMGFDGITHIGGARSRTTPHRVWIAFPDRVDDLVPLSEQPANAFQDKVFSAIEHRQARDPDEPVTAAIGRQMAFEDIDASFAATDDVPASLPELDSYPKTSETDLFEGRVQSLVDQGEADDLYDAFEKALAQQAVDAGVGGREGLGFLHPLLAARRGASGDDPVGKFAELLSSPPGRKDNPQAMWEGAKGAQALQLEKHYEQVTRVMVEAGIGKRRGKRLIMSREEGLPIFRYLDNSGLVQFDELTPGQQRVARMLQRLSRIEEKEMLDFEPTLRKVFGAHPGYFPRIWKRSKRLAGTGPIGAKAGFLKHRKDATFDEILEAGDEPVSWNPLDVYALRRIEGISYRENKLLFERLKRTGDAKPVKKGVKISDNWRVPEVGPAFQGKPYVDKNGELFRTPEFAVPNAIANALESAYGKRSPMPISLPRGKEFDILGPIRFFSTSAKRFKLIGSLFQHVDFATRAGAVAFSPMAIRRGAPLKYPSLVARLANVSLRKAPRDQLRRRVLSTKAIAKTEDGGEISLRGIADRGANFGVDLSMWKRGTMDFLEGAINDAPEGVTAAARRRLGGVMRFFEDGLFDGVYRESQIFGLENLIIPRIIRSHPGWSANDVMAAAADEMNVMFSTLGIWQSVFKAPNTRQFVHALMFSSNESESWLKAGIRGVKGENAALWREYGIGFMIYLGLVSNVINWASTGESLPIEAYQLVATGNHHSPMPGGISYNSKFLSPELPFLGRGNVPVHLDVVGQADTVFRWLLDPPGALTARYNLLPRAVTNQVRGTDFYGRDITGLNDRVQQGLDDLFMPIGPGNISDIVRQQIPATRGVLQEREGRLGSIGSAIQMTGVNVRGMTTPDLLNRAASLSGFTTSDGSRVTSWSQLEPAQRRALDSMEPLNSEMMRRQMTSIERQVTGAEARAALQKIDQGRLDQEEALQSLFRRGEIDGRRMRDRYGDIQAEAASKRIQADTDYNIWKDDPSKLPDDPNKAALINYYNAFERSTNDAGLLEHDRLDSALSTLEAAWSPEQRAYVKRNSGLSMHRDLFMELSRGRERFAPYWRVHNKVLGNDAEIAQYEAFIGVFGEPRTEIRQTHPQLAEAQRVISATRKRMREMLPDLDAFLFRFGYTQTLVHPSNQGRERELAPWLSNNLVTLGT